MDERIDMSRAIRNKRYLYIRNFMPYRAQGVFLNYMFQTLLRWFGVKPFEAVPFQSNNRSFGSRNLLKNSMT